MIRNKENENLNPSTIARKNIKKQVGRTISMISLVLLFALVLSASSFFIKSLNKGLESITNRLGADIMVVPSGFDSKLSGALLKGEASSFYMPYEVVDRLKNVEGIETMSPQLYIATMKSYCCTYPIQIIGYDHDTDFTISPWVNAKIDKKTKSGEVIVGNNIKSKKGENVKFKNNTYKIKAKLEKTSMGFDNVVFMSLEDAREIAEKFSTDTEHPIYKDKNAISIVMVKIKNGFTPRQVIENINNEFKGESIYGVTTENIMHELTKNLQGLSLYLYSLIVLLWIISLLGLGIIFSVIFFERKKEFAIYRLLGASRNFVIKLMLLESFYISLIGAIFGLICGYSISYFFGNFISEKIGLPFMSLELKDSIFILIITLFMATISGPISAFKAAMQMSKKEVLQNLRD